MAKRDTPRSVLQDYIDSVPTTAPVKRTRARSRSPPSRPINETLPSQSKKRRRSSFTVKETPRSMILNYAQGNKTETPFGRASRRRSTTVTPALQDFHTDEITPRTAIQALLKEAPEETPLHRTIRDSSDSEILPNDTIHVLTSPVPDEDSGPITMSQKNSIPTRHHITLKKFSEGVSNRTIVGARDKSLQRSDDELSSSDVQTLPNDSIHIFSSPVPEDDDLPAIRSHRDRRQTQQHITLQQFEDGVRHRKVINKSDLTDMNLTTGRSKLTPSRRISQAAADNDLTPSKRRISSISKIRSNLTPSSGKSPIEQTEFMNSSMTSVASAIRSHRKSQYTLVDERRGHVSPASVGNSKLAVETGYFSPARLIKVSEFPSKNTDLTPSKGTRSRIANKSDADLTPSRRRRSIIADDFSADLTPSRRSRSRVADNSGDDLAPSGRSQSRLADNSSDDLTPSRRSRSGLADKSYADLTPSKRTKSRVADDSDAELTSPISGSVVADDSDAELTPPKSRSVVADDPDAEVTSSRRNRLRVAYNSEVEATSTKRSQSRITDDSSDDLTPRRTWSRVADDSDAELTSSKKSQPRLNNNSKAESTSSKRSQSRLGNDSDANMTPLRRTQSKVADNSDVDVTPARMSRSQIKVASNLKASQQDLSYFGFNVSNNSLNHHEMAHSENHLKSQPERISEGQTKTYFRTPLTSNQTVLENIQPLSSSTPAKVVQKKQSAIGTPSRIKLKSPLSTSTPRRVPVSQTFGLTPSAHRVVNNTFTGTPGRVPVKSINRSKTKDSNQQSRSKSRVTDSGLRSRNRSKIQENLVNSVNFSQSVPDASESEEEYEEDTVELYKLKTPRLKENISRIPTPIYSSTPALVGSQTKQRSLKEKSTNDTVKKSKIKIYKNINTVSIKPKAIKKLMSTVLPNGIIKQAFQHFCKMRVATDTMGELIEFTDTYFENTFKSLEAFALHGRRKVVDESDVELMMKRQGFITEKTPLNVLVEKYLPLELREEIIPMARANNVVTLKE